MLQTRTVEPRTLGLLKDLMLAYFDDAENQIDPVILDTLVSWHTVKETLENEVKHLYQ